MLPQPMALITALTIAAGVAPALAAPGGGPRPNLAAATAYLVSPAHLIGGHYYETVPRVADFGLTIDGALALAATRDNHRALKKIVSFIADGGRDQSGKTADYWTGIGTRFASGGAIGKEALLAEVIGDNPGSFGGHDLIAALDATVCRQASASRCAGPGNYSYATSVFDQALGVIAQLRAGQLARARAPIAFLENLRNPDGSFPSLVPDSHDHDVDSTAMAVMALALVRTPRGRADVAAGVAWIASQQDHAGGFRGVSGVSVNSAGLAIQALSLRATRYRPQIRLALGFLASEQNRDGGFSAYAGGQGGQGGSDVRASAQAVSGATGISFGTLSLHVRSGPATPNAVADRPAGSLLVASVAGLIVVALAAITLRRRRARDRVGS